MRFERITIKNFKQFQLVDVSLESEKSNLVIVYGSAAAGKTALFNAIEWGMCRGGAGIVDKTSIYNSEVLGQTMPGQCIAAVVELVVEYQGRKYKSIKQLEGTVDIERKIRNAKESFAVFSEKNNQWCECNSDILVPKFYMDLLFIGNHELNLEYLFKTKIRRMSAEGYTVENAEKICYELKRRTNVRVSTRKPEELVEYMKYLDEAINEHTYKVQTIKDRLEEIESKIENVLITFSPLAECADRDMGLRVEKERLNHLMRLKNDLLGQMEDKKKQISHLIREYNYYEQMLSKTTTEKNKKYQELLAYVEELYCWIKTVKEEKRKCFIDEWNRCFVEELGQIQGNGNYDLTYEEIITRKDISMWERVFITFAFMGACRAYVYQQDEMMKPEVPFICDNIFADLEKSKVEIVMNYLMKRNEQIILFVDKKIDIKETVGNEYEIVVLRDGCATCTKMV